MTTITDELAFIQAIVTDPTDNTSRLVYADWLDEHGGQPERAAFIRIQCRITCLQRDCNCGACVNLRGGGQHHNGPCAIDKEREDLPDGRSRQVFLRRRERELWQNLKMPVLHRLSHWQRGFMWMWEGTAADWLAHADSLAWHPGATMRCGRCGGNGMVHGSDRSFEWSPDPDYMWCPAKCDHGCILRPCPPTAQPITNVCLTASPPSLKIARFRNSYQWNLESCSRLGEMWSECFERQWPNITFELPPIP